MLVLALGLAVVGCSNSTSGDGGGGVGKTDGKLTITDIPPEFNSKYVAAEGVNADGSRYFYAAADFTKDKNGVTVTLGQVSGGTVTLQVWEINDNYNPVNFNGTLSDVEFGVGIFDKQKYAFDDLDTDEGFMVTVDFNKGVGVAKVVTP
jgi:hypothetical protein